MKNPWEIAYKSPAFEDYTKEEIDEMLLCEIEEIIYDFEQEELESEREMEQSARLREAGISHDEYENGDSYDEGDSSYDDHYN